MRIGGAIGGHPHISFPLSARARTYARAHRRAEAERVRSSASVPLTPSLSASRRTCSDSHYVGRGRLPDDVPDERQPHRQAPKKEDSEDEDEKDKDDAATLKARAWDNWKDEHEKGAGNKTK